LAKIGDDFQAALVDSTLLAATNAKALRAGIDALLDGGDKTALAETAVTEGRRSLPDRPLAWAWLNLAAVRTIPEFKAGLEQVTVDPVATFAFGGLADVTKRAPFVAAGLYYEKNEVTFSLRAPSGREGMKAAPMLVPEDGAGSLPLLEPA